MKYLLIVVMLSLAPLCHAQDADGVFSVVRLRKAYAALCQNKSRRREKAFFDAFPSTAWEFNMMSVSNRNRTKEYNWDTYNIIHKFDSLTTIPDTLYQVKLLTVSANGQYDFDDWHTFRDCVQRRMKPKIMLKLLSKIPVSESTKFWQFYWSEPNHSDCSCGKNTYRQEEYEKLKKIVTDKYPAMLQTFTYTYEYFCVEGVEPADESLTDYYKYLVNTGE